MCSDSIASRCRTSSLLRPTPHAGPEKVPMCRHVTTALPADGAAGWCGSAEGATCISGRRGAGAAVDGATSARGTVTGAVECPSDEAAALLPSSEALAPDSDVSGAAAVAEAE